MTEIPAHLGALQTSPARAPSLAPTNTSDGSLLSGLLNGEEQAFRTWVSAYHGPLIRFARSIIGDAQAEEVVQDAWIKAVKALPQFEGRSSLRVWLFRIVRNEAISHLRIETRAPDRTSVDDLADRFDSVGEWRTPPSIWSYDTPEALLAAEETRAILARTLDEMPEMQRAVLSLRDIEGLSFEDVCNSLEISSSNARVLLHRARRRLWSAIDDSQRE